MNTSDHPALTAYDVIVVGGGHAGCEAAAAAARTGAMTALVTHQASTIGEMSCNPAIGGIGKGHLVREIDALDGIMGRAIDQACIHFKMLNRSKGPAVRGPRAQADRKLYRKAVQDILHNTPNLSIIEGSVEDLITSSGTQQTVQGVILQDGRHLPASAVVLTTGTFLRGVIHCGEQRSEAGRVGEAPSIGLAKRLDALNLRLGRLKTGTPPRIDRRSIAWEDLPEDRGENPPTPFSTLNHHIDLPQISCRISETTADTHQIIRDNLHRSAVYGGMLSGKGPRYCPSIEDKVVRFPDKTRHQVFLEPEGLDDFTVYPNGISTSLPAEIQEALLHSMPGLHNAVIIRPGYAVEYDFVDPRSLRPSLELKELPGLFLAGQINGTTGYEEAGAQGLMAGLNAARKAQGLDSVMLDRSQAYIGVLIDDLTTHGVTEPYRMFTSRSEFRLTLRADNADRRLTRWGREAGCVGAERWKAFAAYDQAMNDALTLASQDTLTPAQLQQVGITVRQDGRRRSLLSLIGSDPAQDQKLYQAFPWLHDLDSRVREQLEIEGSYSGYLSRQDKERRVLQQEDTILLSDHIDYSAIGGLSAEIRDKLQSLRPASLGAASRMEGMTPAALAAISHFVRRKQCFT
ncbi:Glucose inhibited division protein A [Granulibacter bethesdensis]|uniref:tRNA uridine 5-carboxymethylaminomethyl modification enzyme MnmG n=1 Tax=Granulibacter bethesdensis TaxID=364410 RepID=A0AAC9K627_9PROT|nr:tRNA uridine-5-carboxymethylaminomethyl(34) synthesis enzyme MnmG [Granulibacter bethesdensis]APH53230.1 Glucose inhibited division protein A [Granulibacter bethesdensis]APH60806.1 Glucose inhibited division protein A [Granulibacter bethesdensis]